MLQIKKSAFGVSLWYADFYKLQYVQYNGQKYLEIKF